MKRTVTILLMAWSLYAQTGEEVAKRAYERISGYGSSVSVTTMVLENAQGEKNIRKLEIRRLENDGGDRSLLTFLHPADLRGTKLLSYEVIGGDDKQWLYLPAIRRVKRISSRNKSGAFMASEFSYEDIASQHYRNFRYDEKVRTVEKDGETLLQVTRYPIDKHSGYWKQVVYIDPADYLTRRGDFYDRHRKLLKRITFSDYVRLDGVWRAHRIEIYNVQNNKKSTLVWDRDRIRAGLKKKDFTRKVLR